MFLSINIFAKGGYTILEQDNNQKGLIFWYELRDMLAGAAFPIMLQMIISVTFIGMTTFIISSNDIALSAVLLSVGEILLAVAYGIFGRQSGVTSVRRILNHSKKVEIGTNDKKAIFGTGEYSAYKGFLIAFISCVPYIIFQIIQCIVPNTFCDFLLRYVFAWAAIPFSFIQGASPWLNLIMVLLPVAVHGVVYVIFAHREWDKLQRLNKTQKSVSADGDK